MQIVFDLVFVQKIVQTQFIFTGLVEAHGVLRSAGRLRGVLTPGAPVCSATGCMSN